MCPRARRPGVGDAGGLREELRRGAAERGSGRGGPGPRCEASAGRAGAGLASSLEQRSPERRVCGTPRSKGARSASGAVGLECGPGGASVCWGVAWGLGR